MARTSLRRNTASTATNNSIGAAQRAGAGRTVAQVYQFQGRESGQQTPHFTQEIDGSRAENDFGSVAAVQFRLRALGYFHGSAQGYIDDGTRLAIQQFHCANQTAPMTSTQVGMGTWEKMRDDSRCYGYSHEVAQQRLAHFNPSGTANPQTLSSIGGSQDVSSAQQDSHSQANGGYQFRQTISGDQSQNDLDSVAAVQFRLRALGYFHGSAQGYIDDDTRLAIQQFHCANQTAAMTSTTVGPATWEKMRDDAGCYAFSHPVAQQRLAQFNPDGTSSAPTLSGIGTGNTISRAQSDSLTSIGALGLPEHSAIARTQFDFVRTIDGNQEQNDPQSVAAVEERLAQLGYYPGEVTGFFTPALRLAIRMFHTANETGASDNVAVGPGTWERMRDDSRCFAYSRPEAQAALRAAGFIQGTRDAQDQLTTVFDLHQNITIGLLASVLRTIANEPGESGVLAFNFNAEGKFPLTPILQLYGEAWANLQFTYGVSDTLTCTLGVDANAGAAAGLTLAGFAGFSGGGQFGGLMVGRFSSPEDVARWMFEQINRVNDIIYDAVQIRPFPTAGRNVAPDRSPVWVEGTEGAVVGNVNGGVGDNRINLDVAHSTQNTTFRRDGETVTDNGERVQGRTDELSGSLSANADLGWVTINAGYSYAEQNVQGDMNTANNGEYTNHQVHLDLDFSHTWLRSQGSREVPQVPHRDLQDAVLNIFAGFERAAPGGIPLRAVHASFDAVVEQIYQAIEVGESMNAGITVGVNFEWNNVLEGGAYRNQYFRIAASITPHVGGSVNGAVASASAEASASKTEVFYEHIGSETFSYILQNYLFQWDSDQWQRFVRHHRDDIAAMMTNLTDPDHANYNADLARHLQGRDTFEARLRGLEIFFESQRSSIVIGD